MSGPRTILATVVAACALALVAPAAPAIQRPPEPSAAPAAAAERPPAPPRSALAASAAGANYHYASAQSQYVRTRGAKARFTVHRPRQVSLLGDHSLAEIAIRGPDQRDIIEAGWRTDVLGVTRLFVYWWKDGRPQCYNRCGFVRKGRGIKPGSALKPGTAITLAWRHNHGKWKLAVNGKLAGYYPARLWNGGFRRTRLVQVFGEVVTSRLLPCADMGNGRYPGNRRAASIRRVAFVKGPRVRLRKAQTSSGYGLRLLNRKALRYGGRGRC